jgi:transcriptional regulator with XRE-family HTH domain
MAMHINGKIKQRRWQLNLTKQEVAGLAGLNYDSYWDIEEHEDEIENAVSLRDIKRLLEVLGMDLLETLSITCADEKKVTSADSAYTLPRNELVRKMREKKGVTSEQFADSAGFSLEAFQRLEEEPEEIDNWELNDILVLSERLAIPIHLLLGVTCAEHKSCEEVPRSSFGHDEILLESAIPATIKALLKQIDMQTMDAATIAADQFANLKEVVSYIDFAVNTCDIKPRDEMEFRALFELIGKEIGRLKPRRLVIDACLNSIREILARNKTDMQLFPPGGRSTTLDTEIRRFLESEK